MSDEILVRMRDRLEDVKVSVGSVCRAPRESNLVSKIHTPPNQIRGISAVETARDCDLGEWKNKAETTERNHMIGQEMGGVRTASVLYRKVQIWCTNHMSPVHTVGKVDPADLER